jgi:hypothetical protein
MILGTLAGFILWMLTVMACIVWPELTGDKQ